VRVELEFPGRRIYSTKIRDEVVRLFCRSGSHFPSDFVEVFGGGVGDVGGV